jgi:hypothetical protein
LEREIRICSEGIADRKVILEAMEKKKKKDNADLFVIEDFKKQIADLENQIYVMMGALNNTEVLQVDDQQQYELPLNMFANINKQIEDLKFQIAKKSNDIDKPYLNEVEDKKRRNNLIVDVVLTNLKYYTYQKLKNENKLLDLYLTKKDLKDVVIKFGKGNSVDKVVLNVNVAGTDELIIENETSIDTLVYQLNTIEKNVETLNKEKNIDLIFTEMKNELLNKFII